MDHAVFIQKIYLPSASLFPKTDVKLFSETNVSVKLAATGAGCDPIATGVLLKPEM